MVFEFRPILVVVPSQEPAVPFHLDLMDQRSVEAPLRGGGRVFLLLGQDQLLKEGVARVKDQSLAGLEDHVVASGAFHDGSVGQPSLCGFDDLADTDPLLEIIELDVSSSRHRYIVYGDTVSLYLIAQLGVHSYERKK